MSSANGSVISVRDGLLGFLTPRSNPSDNRFSHLSWFEVVQVDIPNGRIFRVVAPDVMELIPVSPEDNQGVGRERERAGLIEKLGKSGGRLHDVVVLNVKVIMSDQTARFSAHEFQEPPIGGR